MTIVKCRRLTGNRLRIFFKHANTEWSEIRSISKAREEVRFHLGIDPSGLNHGETLTKDRDGKARVDGKPLIAPIGRPPVGEYAMTGAERASRFRERKRKAQECQNSKTE